MADAIDVSEQMQKVIVDRLVEWLKGGCVESEPHYRLLELAFHLAGRWRSTALADAAFALASRRLEREPEEFERSILASILDSAAASEDVENWRERVKVMSERFAFEKTATNRVPEVLISLDLLADIDPAVGELLGRARMATSLRS